MKAIVLAAGMGTRLKPITDSIPKCLIEINGKAILVNMLEHLNTSGVKETTLVIGYLGDLIRNKIGDHFKEMKINYVVNSIYDKTNSSYSLWLALKEIIVDECLLILEGDVFFDQTLLENFINDDFPACTVVQEYHPPLDGTFIELENDVVVKWVHKYARPNDFDIEGKFKTVNITKFDKSFSEDILIPTLNQHIEQNNGIDPFEFVMNDIVTKKGGNVHAFHVGMHKWFEVDNHEELRIAEEIFEVEKPTLDDLKSRYGGYWRYNLKDFHYLYNNYFPTKALLAELQARLPRLLNRYPSTHKVIAKLITGWRDDAYFSEGKLVLGNGASELIRILNRIMTKVTIPIPTFNEYVQLSSEKMNIYVMEEKNNFQFDADKLIEEVKRSKSEYTVLVNPNNPIGNIISRDDIEKILDTGVNTILDESFIDYARSGSSCEDLTTKYENLIIIKSMTKTHGIAGIRLGYMLTSNEDIRTKVKDQLPIWNINSIAECFIEIFPRYKNDYEESIRKVKEDREYLFKGLKKVPYLEPFESYANFIFCRTEISAKRISDILYNKFDITIKTGLNQESMNSDSYIRVGVQSKKNNDNLLRILNSTF